MTSTKQSSSVQTCGKPFLRWAGGKNWFIKKYLFRLTDGLNFEKYYEPFLGGGSAFFALQPKASYLSDLNDDLIATYIGIRDSVDDVITKMQEWPNNEETYYRVRSLQPTNQAERAARFIYLNRTSFNGIWRVNRAGQYNVPYGHNEKYSFDYNRIRACSLALDGAHLKTQSFENALMNVEKNSLVFIDPPYTVSHNNNGFIEYNKTLFSLENQYTLRNCIDAIMKNNSYFIMTNAAHNEVAKIFQGAGKRYKVSRSSTLGGKNAKRGRTDEYVFTNIPITEIGEDV